jgi:hypothetical protein
MIHWYYWIVFQTLPYYGWKALTFCSLFFLHWENTNRLKTTSTRNPLHIDPIHLSDQICQPRDVIEEDSYVCQKLLRIIGMDGTKNIHRSYYPATFIKYASAESNGYHIMDFILMITCRYSAPVGGCRRCIQFTSWKGIYHIHVPR